MLWSILLKKTVFFCKNFIHYFQGSLTLGSNILTFFFNNKINIPESENLRFWIFFSINFCFVRKGLTWKNIHVIVIDWLKSTFFEIYSSLRVLFGYPQLKKLQKTLILANISALSCQNGPFFRVFANYKDTLFIRTWKNHKMMTKLYFFGSDSSESTSI